MNYDLLFALIFYATILFLFFRYRSRFEVQNRFFVLYKTRLGLRAMDRFATRLPVLLKIIGISGILFGFLGMGFIFYTLVRGAVTLILTPEATPILAPVLPGVKIGGIPLSFWHWIIAIFITATVHEFSHGVFARLYRVNVKSSGFAFLGPILAAFVEPDEKVLAKRKRFKQLSVFSAGPFANIVTGILFLLLLNFATGPIQIALFEQKGVTVNEVLDGYPVSELGLDAPFTIREMDGKIITNITDFISAVEMVTPGEKIRLVTDKGAYLVRTVKNPDNESRAFIGVGGFAQKQILKKEAAERYGERLPGSIPWINMLVLWLFLINIGIGLFNLLPLGPIDGGRMFFVLLLVLFREKERAARYWKAMSSLCIILIIINLFPWLMKLLAFLARPLLLLI